jgi:uncharacterized protein (TIGR00288 family)
MANPPDTPSMAVFCDFENVALGVRDAKYEKFDIRKVLERLLLKGSIVVKKAYCDWERYREFKAPMHEASFELIEIPHVRQSGKNSADIRMVVDALDLCYTKGHVDTFVIISGDSDFSPLVSKLRENNKTVIGVGVKGSTSDLLTANCDEFIFYDDLVREQRRRGVQSAARRDGGRDNAREAPREGSRPVPGAVGVAATRGGDVARAPAWSGGLYEPGPTVGGPLRSSTYERGAADMDHDDHEAQSELDGVLAALDRAGTDTPGTAQSGEAPVDTDTQDVEAQAPVIDDAAPAPAAPARRRRSTRAGAAAQAAAKAEAAAAPNEAQAPSDAATAVDMPVEAEASPATDGPKKRAPRRRKALAGEPVAERGSDTGSDTAVEQSIPEAPVPVAMPEPAAGPSEFTRSEPRSDDDKRQEAVELVIETVEALIVERGADDKIWGSMVKQTLKRRRPGFAESYYGYRSFNELLEEARDRGLLALDHDEKSGGYVIRLL